MGRPPQGRSTGHKSKSTHGSLTKAGKVRQQTPKIPKTVNHVSMGPRLGKRRRYWHLILAQVEEEACRQFRQYLNHTRDSVCVVINTGTGPYYPPKSLVASIISKNFSREPRMDRNP